MKRKRIFYAALAALFLLTATVFVLHVSRLSVGINRLFNQNAAVRVPFEMSNGKITVLHPEAADAGVAVGDALAAINGHVITDDEVWTREINKLRIGEAFSLTLQRTRADGTKFLFDASIIGQKFEISAGRLVRDLAILILFALLLPAVSFALGFYVALVRVRDPLAWLLLLLLLSVGSIALEGGQNGSLTYFFQQTTMNLWGIWMFLFGIYFPERWRFDIKYPWAKWILLAPLVVSGFLSLFEQTGRLFGWRALWEQIDNSTKPFDSALTILTMLATGMFFAILAMKAATLANKDSRRRLKILYIGTSAAMLPALGIVLYRIASGIGNSSFFDLVPAWFAVLALVMLLVFPLTMAYVIVVERAMDVSVVIRLGLQYTLASGGVKVLQAVFLVALIFWVVLVARSYRENAAAQIGFIAAGFALVPLIDYAAKNLRVWIDRKFFREAYDAERILSELSEDVRTMVETKPLLETVSTRISESLHVPQIALLLKNGDEFQPAYALGYNAPPTIGFSENDATVEKLRRNEPLTVYQEDRESWVNDEIAETEREKLKKLNSQLLLPIGAKDALAGVISLSPKRSEEPYTPNDLRLLKLVAVQTGLALENSRLTETIAREAAQKERLNRELEIAREVQQRLFPQELPATEGLDYTGACRPALGVGGDYYDFLELPDNKFGIAIGDVSGKGIGASLMMASLQASLRGQAIHCGNHLAELMKHVNTLVYEASTSNRYATFFYAQLDTKTLLLSYVNAGHNPPFLLRKNGDLVRLDEGGAVVGMLPSMFVHYTQGEIRLETGDLLVGYTDGISEAMNPREEEWGEDAMLAELENVYEKSSEEILNHIVARADAFADGAKQHDDMTMIIVKVVA